MLCVSIKCKISELIKFFIWDGLCNRAYVHVVLNNNCANNILFVYVRCRLLPDCYYIFNFLFETEWKGHLTPFVKTFASDDLLAKKVRNTNHHARVDMLSVYTEWGWRKPCYIDITTFIHVIFAALPIILTSSIFLSSLRVSFQLLYPGQLTLCRPWTVLPPSSGPRSSLVRIVECR